MRKDEISVLEYMRIIRAHVKFIAAFIIVASVIAVTVSLLLPKTYRAEALILPMSDQGGGGGDMSGIAAQFGGLAALAGVNLGGSDDNIKLVTLLESRTLTESVINKMNLKRVLFKVSWDTEKAKWKDTEPTMEAAVAILKTHMTFNADKTNETVFLGGEFGDPKIAAEVVNAYLDELKTFLNDNTMTVARKNRLFIEEQLAENQIEYLEAGKEISAFYEGKGISSTEADLDVSVRGSPNMNNLVDEKPKFASLKPGKDAGLRNLMAEKVVVEKKLAEAEVVKDVPQQVYLQYLLLRQHVLSRINVLLASQYEMAMIEETKEGLEFQVIDNAVPPMTRYKPKRAQICVTSFILSLLFAIVIVLIRDYLEKQKAHAVVREC